MEFHVTPCCKASLYAQEWTNDATVERPGTKNHRTQTAQHIHYLDFKTILKMRVQATIDVYSVGQRLKINARIEIGTAEQDAVYLFV